MTIVPWAWIQSSERTKRPGSGRVVARRRARLRSVNGSRRLGTNRPIASVMCVARMSGNSGQVGHLVGWIVAQGRRGRCGTVGPGS